MLRHWDHSNVEMVKEADAIVRARAVEYARWPWSLFRTTGVPDSKVRFQVLENVRGLVVKEVALPGYLVSSDDYSDDYKDEAPPYSFARPGGRAGSCFASSYRRGGEYLLFLMKKKTGELTVNWAALAPSTSNSVQPTIRGSCGSGRRRRSLR